MNDVNFSVFLDFPSKIFPIVYCVKKIFLALSIQCNIFLLCFVDHSIPFSFTVSSTGISLCSYFTLNSSHTATFTQMYALIPVSVKL